MKNNKISMLKISNSKEFKNLYQPTSKDEKIIELQDDNVGIMIIRNYPERTEYFKDNNKILITLFLSNDFLCGSVEMVKEIDDRKFIIINKKYKKRYTNFLFDEEEKIKLILKNKDVLVKVKNKELTLNDFIDKLVENHLSDKTFWIRKKNFIKIIFLKILFFISDDKYDFAEYYSRLEDLKENRDFHKKEEGELKIKEEPFFKYFKIYKNMLFAFCVIFLLLLIAISKFKPLLYTKLSLSDPIFLLIFFVCLFLLHYFSNFIYSKKRDKNGFIYKIHIDLLNPRVNINLKF